MGYELGVTELGIMHRRMAGMLKFSCKESCYYTLIGVLRTPWWLRVPTGHISLYSMYPVMGNQRPTDAWCPMGYRPTAFSRPGTSRYARCTRLWGISVLRTYGARWVTGSTAFSRPGTSRYARYTRLWGISVLRTHGARWVTGPQLSRDRRHNS